jgi:hypothetical protein
MFLMADDLQPPHMYFFESMQFGTVSIQRLVTKDGKLLDSWGLIIDDLVVRKSDGLPMAWESAGDLAKRIEMRLTGVPKLAPLSWDGGRPRNLSGWQTSAPSKEVH